MKQISKLTRNYRQHKGAVLFLLALPFVGVAAVLIFSGLTVQQVLAGNTFVGACLLLPATILSIIGLVLTLIWWYEKVLEF